MAISLALDIIPSNLIKYKYVTNPLDILKQEFKDKIDTISSIFRILVYNNKFIISLLSKKTNKTIKPLIKILA